MKIKLCIFLFILILSLPGSVPGKMIRETADIAIRLSRKNTTELYRKTVEESVQRVVLKYGDSVLPVIRSGGLEAMELGLKHGAPFWDLCKNAPPSAIRSLALHPEELLPFALKTGPEFLQLEGKVPGLGIKTVKTFGADSVKALSKAPENDISRLLGYASKTDDPSTRQLLLKTYQKGGTKFLNALNRKQILAGGLSAAAIIAAYKTSDGISAAIQTFADNNPVLFAFSLFSAITLAAIILLYPLFRLLWKLTEKKIRKRKI